MTDIPLEPLIDLSLECAHCGRFVRLTYRRTTFKQPISWSCPHAACGRSQVLQVSGTIVGVARGATPQPADSEAEGDARQADAHGRRDRGTLEL